MTKLYNDKISNNHFDFEVDDGKKSVAIDFNKSRRDSSNKIKPSYFENHPEQPSSQTSITLKTTIQRKSKHNLSLTLDSNKQIYKERIKNVFKKEKRPLFLSILDLISARIFKKKENLTKYKQRKNAVRAVLQKLDISFLLNKIAELEKLKMILMDHDQFKLFDYLPKPTIQVNQNIKYHYKLEKSNRRDSVLPFPLIQEEEMDAKAKAAYSALQNILNKPNLDPQEKKLVSMLYEDVAIEDQTKNGSIIFKDMNDNQFFNLKKIFKAIQKNDE